MLATFFYCLYQIVASVGVIVYLFVALFTRKKSRRNYLHKYGFIEKSLRKKLKDNKYIWIHVVSVGESIAASPLIEKLLQSGYKVLISNVTDTGNKVTLKRFGDRVETIFFPLDFKPIISYVLNLVDPKWIVIVETEIWPCFLRETSKRNIPVFLVNGRISDRSFKMYSRFSFFFSETLSHFTKISMQSREDAERIIKIGAEEQKVTNLGNMKFDVPVASLSESEILHKRKELSIGKERRVICFGSTHQGEEEIAIEVFLSLKKDFKELFLVLVPRHPERSVEIYNLLEKSGCKTRLISELTGKSEEPFDVLLVNTVGELITMYSLSEFAVVCGSLVPFGGHNILEPAAVEKPAIFGQYMHNFMPCRELMLRCHGGIEVKSREELLATCKKLLTDPELVKEMGKHGKQMVKENQGAVEKNFGLISRSVIPICIQKNT